MSIAAAGETALARRAGRTGIERTYRDGSRIAATADSVGRETRSLTLAHLASRTAAAARRLLAGLPIDPRRDVPALVTMSELLATAAETLVSSEPRTTGSTRGHDSYALARITHSALTSSPNLRLSGDRPEDDTSRRRTATELQELRDQIQTMLADEADSATKQAAAENVRRVFEAVGASVLSGLGGPGDTLGGATRSIHAS